jgi:hypothetical protein
MAVGGVSFVMPQAYSGGADFSPLANLGNVYRQGQQQSMQQSALAQLGSDPAANAAILIKSGVPSLAQLGMSMQNQLSARAEQVREWEAGHALQVAASSRAAAAEKRAQETYEKQQDDEEKAAAAIAGLLPTRRPPDVAAPPVAPAPPVQDFGNNNQGVSVPLAPGQAPPDAPSVPLAEPAAVRVPVADRVVNTLASGQPASSSGVTREQIGELYRNPLTRPLAATFLQNQMSPGTWKVEKTDDGRVIAVNDRTLESRDVTPPTSSGAAPATKQEREVQGYYQAGKNLGMSDQQAQAFAANKGKTPKEDLSPAEEKRVNTLTDETRTAQRTLANIEALKTLSKDAWGFPGAGKLSEVVAPIPILGTASGATDTQDLINAAHSNVANVAKTIFPQRVTNTDLNLLKDLEGSASQPDAVRQRIWARAETAFKKIIDENTADLEAIRNKTFYKPGGGTQAQEAPKPAAGPTLGEFMTKARAANPGYSDSEIAREWKQRYGG